MRETITWWQSRQMGRHLTEQRVLAYLRQASRPTDVADIADRVGVSHSTARFHLDKLIAAGAVHQVNDPRTRPRRGTVGGRPRLLYRARPAEGVDEAAAYRALASLLAEEVATTSVDLDRVGRRWAEALLANRQRRSPRPVEAVVMVLSDHGFQPTMSQDGSLIELHRCPFEGIVNDHSTVVCSMHACLVSSMLDQLGTPTEVALNPHWDGSPCVLSLTPSPVPIARVERSPTLPES